MGGLEVGPSRAKVVLLGAEGVGKTSILRRFLFDQFQHQPRPTVEEMYSRDFPLATDLTLRVDLLDTCGADQFPAMRRMALLTGHAFLIVYSLASPASLQVARARLEELRQVPPSTPPPRPPLLALPLPPQVRGGLAGVAVVVAGNKADLTRGRGYLARGDGDWLARDFPGAQVGSRGSSSSSSTSSSSSSSTSTLPGQVPLLECSARDNTRVTELFQALVRYVFAGTGLCHPAGGT